MSEFSRRALEEAEDALAGIDRDLTNRGLEGTEALYQLDGSGTYLNRQDIQQWMRESVDEGFPRLVWHVVGRRGDAAVVNIAAYEDPDSQYHP